MKSIDNKYEIEVQSSIDKLNAEFWSELCGTSLAKKLGLPIQHFVASTNETIAALLVPITQSFI